MLKIQVLIYPENYLRPNEICVGPEEKNGFLAKLVSSSQELGHPF